MKFVRSRYSNIEGYIPEPEEAFDEFGKLKEDYVANQEANQETEYGDNYDVGHEAYEPDLCDLNNATYKDNNGENPGARKPPSLFGVIFVATFFGIILTSYLLSRLHSDLLFPVFGFGFLMIGSVIVYASRKKPIVYFLGLFPLVGLTIMGIGVFKSDSSFAYADDHFLMTYFAIAAYIGAGLSIASLIATKLYRGTGRTKKITTQCRALIIKTVDAENVYCPVYSIFYCNKVYNLCEDEFSGGVVPNIGEKVQLYIDPFNPYSFSRKGGNLHPIFIFVAGFLLLMGTLLFVFA